MTKFFEQKYSFKAEILLIWGQISNLSPFKKEPKNNYQLTRSLVNTAEKITNF